MKRNIFTRLLHRGRKLLGGRRRKARALAPSFLRLETLEDRRLLSAGFGASSLFGRLASQNFELSIQQPTAVSPSSVSYASSIQISEQSLFSLLSSLNLGSSEGASIAGSYNSSLTSSTDLFTSANSTANNLVTPVASTANTMAHATQPSVTTSTNGVPATLLLVPNLLFIGSQTSQPPLPSAPSVGTVLAATVTAPTTVHPSTVAPPSANAGSTPVSLAIPPALPPSIDVPSAPVDSVPVAPPAQPDAAPTMPTVPTAEPTVQPVVPGPLDNVPTSVTPIQMSVVTPALTPETPPVAPPALDNTPPSPLPVHTSLAMPPVVPPSAVPATADAPLAASEIAIAETAEAEPAKGPTLDFAALLLNANSTSANDVTPPQPGSATAAPLSGASDELFTRLAYDTAQKATITAKEMLTPSSEHWMRYVAPVFIAMGAYFGTRLADKKKTNECRPALKLAN